jgi:hypothetical protein
MSTAPQLHKAKDEWAKFASKRPAPDVSSPLLIIKDIITTHSSVLFVGRNTCVAIQIYCFSNVSWSLRFHFLASILLPTPKLQHLDAHKCFHPPYNPLVIGGGIVMVWVLGYGSMYFGFSWQQKKQGYWK